MKKLLGIVVLCLLLIPTLAMSGTFKDEEGKFGLKTKKSGFKFHKNFMDHKDYNFQYIKDKKKHVLETIFSDLNLETVIALEMIFGVIVKLIEKELNFQQNQDRLQKENNAMDIV